MKHLRNIEMDCARDAEVLLKERREMLAAGRERLSKGMDLRSSIHRAQRDPAVQNEDPERCDRVLDSLALTIQVPTARLNAMTQIYSCWMQILWSISDTAGAYLR